MYRGSVQRFIPSFRIHFKKQAESEGELVDSRAPRPSSPFAGPVSSCGVRLPSLKPLHHLRRRLFPLLWRHQANRLRSGDAVSSSDSSVSSEEGRHCQNHLLVSDLRWFVTKRSKICHIVQEDAGGFLVPWCRSSSFAGSPAEDHLRYHIIGQNEPGSSMHRQGQRKQCRRILVLQGFLQKHMIIHSVEAILQINEQG